jgi:uncharacterized membrane protein
MILGTIPDFWRTEVLHPLSVHFPIVLLLLATVAKTIALFSKRETYRYGGSILLFLGVLGSWISIYTGDLADGIVARDLCDPTVLKTHENWAYYAAWLFTIAYGLDLFPKVQKKHASRLRYFLQRATVVVLVAGTASLMYVGHLGATLTYQQAAGVYVPSSDCSEFE